MVPIAEYERNCGFSRWTIQTTIKTLLDHGCMTIEKCGPKGTFLEKINYEKTMDFLPIGILSAWLRSGSDE